MNRQKQLCTYDKKVIHLRYHESLYRFEIAGLLRLSVNQIRHVLSKPIVRMHIWQVVMPDLLGKKIKELEEALSSQDSLVDSFVRYLGAEMNVKGSLWLGPGRKKQVDTSRSNARQFRATHKFGQILGCTDPRHSERNTKRMVLKHGRQLAGRLELLKSRLHKVERTTEPRIRQIMNSSPKIGLL